MGFNFQAPYAAGQEKCVDDIRGNTDDAEIVKYEVENACEIEGSYVRQHAKADVDLRESWSFQESCNTEQKEKCR